MILAIVGATGFIGASLLANLKSQSDYQLKVLVRQKGNHKLLIGENIELIEGDLLKPETLNELIVPGCTVVNLGYLKGHPDEENMDAVANLAEVCVRKKIKRFIHCSTAVVAGRVRNRVIDENTECNPRSEYENLKFKIENLLFETYSRFFEVVVLRPTAVFGPNGKNLIKLSDDLRTGNRVVNYLKSCLFNYRKMNLVYVDNVVSSLGFLIDSKQKLDRQIFIISDDDSVFNNYRQIEQYLMSGLGHRDYMLPIIPLPLFILSFLLLLKGQSNLNPDSIYDSRKITGLGCHKPVDFRKGLSSFADWYKSKYFERQEQEIHEDTKC